MTAYLGIDDVRDLFGKLTAGARRDGDSFPEWTAVDHGKLASALAAPRQAFGGIEMYPSLQAKSAVLLYSLAKAHALPDGNKRFALSTTQLFLVSNERWWDATSEDIRVHVTWIATSESALRTQTLGYMGPYLELRVTTLDEIRQRRQSGHLRL